MFLGFAARENTAPPFTANKMLKLLEAACDHVTGENWAKVIEKTKKIVLEDWERYVRIDRIRDQEMIINLGEESDTTDSDISEKDD